MKIAICGSMTACKKMIQMEEKLIKMGHKVVLPRHTREYAKLNTSDHVHNESYKNKINHDLIRVYYDEIKNCDAVLVINETRHGIKNYIGGNSFLEMAFAHILHKKIFLLNPIPKMLYTDELIAMQPVVLNGDLGKLSID